MPGIDPLVHALQAFKVTITKHRSATFEGAGEHDDLVVAAALAVWWTAMKRVLQHRVLEPRGRNDSDGAA